MGGIESVFIPALSGYVYHRTSYKYRSQINRESGYHVLFRSAVIGIFSYPVAYLIAWLLSSYLPSILVSNFQFLTGWISIGLCWSVARIKNQRSDNEEVEAEVAAEMGDFLSLLMRECNKRDKMMEITFIQNQSVKRWVAYLDVLHLEYLFQPRQVFTTAFRYDHVVLDPNAASQAGVVEARFHGDDVSGNEGLRYL